MITNNGKALCFCSDYADDHPNWLPSYTLQRTNGIAETIYRHCENVSEKLSYSYLCDNLEIIVGSGNAPVTVNDYCLNNEIISTNLKVLFQGSRNAQNINVSASNPIILHATKTFYNASLIDNITIKEIGLITKDGYGYEYLLLREVLNNPIILGPDETISLTITIN